MVDEIYDRQYQAGRGELHAGLERGFAVIARGLGALHRFEWSAPWKAARPAKDDRAGLA